MKSRKDAYAAAIIALAGLCIFAVSCKSPLLGGSEAGASGSGEVSLTFHMPPSIDAQESSGARVFDPNTAAIVLRLRGVEAGRVGIADGERTGTVWSGKFKAVPVGTYAPGEFVVALLNSSGSVLALGSNGAAVQVAKGAASAVRITTKPDASIITDAAFNQAFSINVASGSSRYYRLRDYYVNKNFSPTLYHPVSEATFLILDANGSLLYDNNGNACVAHSTGMNEGNHREWYSLAASGDLYFGVISDSVNGSPYKAEAYIFDSQKAVMATYSGWDANPPPDDHGDWIIREGETLDVVVPPGRQADFNFRFQNVSAGNPPVNFPHAQPVEISSSDPRIALRYQDDVGAILWGGWSFGYGIRIRTDDIGSGISLDGDSGTVQVTVPNDASPGGALHFTLRYTVGDGVARMSILYRGQRVPNHGIIDLGDLAYGGMWDIPLNFNNNSGQAQLRISSGAITPLTGNAAAELELNSFPAPNPDGSFTFPPNSGYGNTLRLNLQGRTAVDEGATASSLVSFQTNDSVETTFSFTVTYRIALWQPPMWMEAVPGATVSSVSVKWLWNPAQLPDATGFRIYRSLSWEGPYALIATAGTNDASAVDVLDKGGEPAKLYSYVDAGLALDTVYYYKICATLAGASHVTGQTVVSWYPERYTPYDPALLDAWDTVGGALSTRENAPDIPLGTTVTTKLYPMGDEDFFSFEPVPGTTYTVTVSQAGINEGMVFTMETKTSNSPDANKVFPEVNPWGADSRSIVWPCPVDFPTGDRVVIRVNAYDRTYGPYSILVTD
jgi:hypothetical protein